MTHTITKEKSLEHLLARELRALDTQSQQEKDAEFKQALESLIEQYDLSASTAVDILRADRPEELPPVRTPRERAPLKVFRNPYTRETLKTHSFSHHTLEEWRKRHGSVTVQTWRVK